MVRIYHRFEKWEEYHAGMWRVASKAEQRELLPVAVALIKDTAVFGAAMVRVVEEWTFSCEHNLTNLDSNRVAWIGQAACCLATSCTEDVTRKAWGLVSNEDRRRANGEAETAIEKWRVGREGENLELFSWLG